MLRLFILVVVLQSVIAVATVSLRNGLDSSSEEKAVEKKADSQFGGRV